MKSSRRVPAKLRRTIVYDGRIIRVERDRVRLATGRTKDMEIVRHRGSVVLVPQPARDRVILIRQYRYVIRRWLWELPAGSLEVGERPAAAARRECEEEIGLRPGRVTRLGLFYPTPGFCDERMIFYRCEQLVRPRQPIAGDEDEQIEPRAMSVAAAWRLVGRGQIIDMKTILGLVLLRAPAGRPRAAR